MGKPSVTNLEQYGESGWQWTVNNQVNYRTNQKGNGLWACGSYEGGWADAYQDRQVQGTCQFWLPETRKAAYDKIRREFSIP